MKPIVLIKPRQIFCIVLLSGILSSGMATVTAASPPRNVPSQRCKPTRQRQSDRATRVPRQVVDAVRQDIAQRESIPVNRLRVTQSSQQTWSDGCLGLAQADEFCTQALVEGWRITVSDGRSTWVYRTDSSGRVVRREEPQTTSSVRNLFN